MCTCLQARIYQRASLALFHSLLNTYLWTVLTWTLSDTDSSKFLPKGSLWLYWCAIIESHFFKVV